MILYLLDKSQKAIQAIPSEKLVEAKYTEGINEASKLTFSVPLKERLPSNAFFALFQKPDCSDFLLFKINNETIENDRISYMGVDAAYDELKSYSYVKDIRPVQKTAKEILQRVLQGTRWEVGYIDSTGTMDTNFYYQPLLECIQNIAQLFNMEVVFTYGFDSKYQVITSRKVNFYQQQGQRTGKRFEYGSNLLTVTREEDSQDIVTALVGRGKGEETTDEETGEATGGYGRRINFSDVVWSKAKGDPADKPAGQEYVEDVQATKVFGYDDGKPRIGIVVFEDIEDPVELLKATWTSLKSSDRPKVTFKANVTDVGNLGLGDTIAIIRHELGIEYFTRVFKVIHDLLNKQNNTVEMGDDLSGNSLTSYVSSVSSLAQSVQQQATIANIQASSKNKNFYSTIKPAIADEGDNLFLDLGNGDFEHWVWHNHQWEFIQSTKDLHNVEQNVKDQQAELEKVKKSTNDMNDKVDNLHHDTIADIAIIKTSLKGAQDDIVKTKNDIQADIANTQSDLANAKSDIVNAKKDIQANGGRISSIDKRVDGLSVTVGNNTGNISKVDQKADTIKSTVVDNTNNISKVDQKANEISKIVATNTDSISKVDQKANEIRSTVADNTRNLSTVTQTANELKSTVADNTRNLSTVTQTANNVSSIVNDKNTGLSAVLQKVDSVSSVINDREHGLSAIYQKADSLATEIVGKADTSQVVQLSNQIKTKIESKDFTSQINQINTNINLKVSKGDIIGQLNIEAGSTLIQNKKLYLDADSVVFSGKAFIPDAAITDISADKITAGTLDAGKINVINLNADDVTSGILNGANSYFDLNNGVLNVRNSKDESVFLKDGNLIFSAFKKWQGYSDIYGEITMNTTNSLDGTAEGTLDISSKNGFAIRDGGIEQHDDTSDHGEQFSGEGALIWAYSPKKKNAVTGHSLAALNINAYDSIRIKTGRIDPAVSDIEDWSTPLLALSNDEGVPGLTPGIYMQGGQVDVTTKNFVVTLTDGGESTIYGDFTVTGSKNAVVPTSKGMTAINAYETAEYYFGDIGKAKTDENGQVIIQLDPLFLETVNTSIPYHVFISSYGNATVWAEQMDKNSFLVKSSKPNIKFSWEIKAKRLGYENNRLKIAQKGIPKKLVKRYKEKGIL